MQNEGTRLLRVKVVAALFDVHPSTVYRAIQAGELDVVKIGGSLRVPERAVTAYLEGNTTTSVAEVA